MNSNNTFNLLMNKNETQILKQIVTEFKLSCKWFFSKEDWCIYFIFENTLYGYSDIGGLEGGNIKLVWCEQETDYSINFDDITQKEKLIKKPSKKYNLLDYDELVNLYSKLNLSRHLNNRKK